MVHLPNCCTFYNTIWRYFHLMPIYASTTLGLSNNYSYYLVPLKLTWKNKKWKCAFQPVWNFGKLQKTGSISVTDGYKLHLMWVIWLLHFPLWFHFNIGIQYSAKIIFPINPLKPLRRILQPFGGAPMDLPTWLYISSRLKLSNTSSCIIYTLMHQY